MDGELAFASSFFVCKVVNWSNSTSFIFQVNSQTPTKPIISMFFYFPLKWTKKF